MNGRIYDFNVGRFLSVDPFLQFPENSQSANPYSYILNNPMAGTDPTGYACAGSNLESVCDNYFKDNKIVTENMKLTDAISNTLNNGKATASNGQANELQMAQTGGAAKQEKKAVGLQLNTDKQSLSYGNDPSFIKGYDSVEGDMSGILSMTGPALAVDAVKAGIEIANEIADEYEKTGLSSSTLLVAGKAVGEAALDVGLKKVKILGVAKDVHGNSKLSEKAQHVYEIRNNKTGEVVKTGVSQGKISKEGKSYRAERQRRKWGKDNFDTTIIAEIPAGPGARQKALDIEASNARGLRPENLINPDYHVRP
jgi:hypothetical protein